MDGDTIMGIACFVALVSVFVGLFVIARPVGKFTKTLPARMARAHPGKGTVVSIRKSSSQNRGSDIYSMRINFEVQPGSGDVYRAPAFWQVREVDIPQIQPGTVHDVHIDADDREMLYSKR